jgi:DNA-binding NarL/FixJ family response regulator
MTHHDVLTDRQKEVAGLTAEGLSDQAIAFRLKLEPATIQYHLQNVYETLGLSVPSKNPRVMLCRWWWGV